MFTRAFFAAAVVAVAAAAPEARKPQPCGDVPVRVVPDVTVVANSKICSPLPAGVCGSGVMVANVTYELPCAFGCPSTTTVWCEGNAIVDENKKTCASKYWFCCGKDCKGVPAPRTCTYENKDYTVGVAYDLGNGKTMWCVDEETAVTCTGKECGSTLDLTPPRVETCPVAPVKPLPPKPQPQPQPECHRHTDCRKVNGLALECHNGKCVPAQGPKPECHRHTDCHNVNGLALECYNGKCVPSQGPHPDVDRPVDPEFSYCRNDRECPAAHECKNGKCEAVRPPVVGPVDPEYSYCRNDRECPAAHECRNGKCEAARPPVQGPLDNEFSYCRNDGECPATHRCRSGQCVA